MTPGDRVALLHASGGSLGFYERITKVRATASGRVGSLEQLDLDSLPTLEAQFLDYGKRLERLLERYPEGEELRAAIVAHGARKASLGL